MKSAPSRLLYGVIALAAVAWFVASRAGGEEAKIRARLEQVRELVVKEAGEKALQSADRARRLGSHLTDPFVMRIEPAGLEIEQATALVRPFVGLRQGVESLEVSFSALEIEVAEGGSSARSAMRASLRATGDRARRGSYRVEILWRLDGRWRIEHVDVADLPDGGGFL
ncbi:MAG: hypothetical protein AAF725_19645 [Acidobacteriota bacterium]